MKAARKAYKHEPLASPTSIRLLRLGDRLASTLPEAYILCQIDQFKLADAPSYVALSYLWGDPKPNRTVLVDGKDGEFHTCPVNENLWYFLRQLALWQGRLGASPNYYWTDCLCLDQSSPVEISQQVPRMGAIYSTAFNVIAWLGHRDWIVEAMQGVDYYARKSDSETSLEVRKHQIKGAAPGLSDHADMLFDLSYWSRIWIVQEVVLAREIRVMAGQVSIDLGSLLAKLEFIFRAIHEDRASPYDGSNLQRLGEMRKTQQRKRPLYELIMYIPWKDSTRIIDKVYGLLGLVADHEDGTSPAALIEASIDKKPFEVFWDTVFECRAPTRMIEGVIYRLNQMLLPSIASKDLAMVLELYACEPRTSFVHLNYAVCALGAYTGWELLRDQLLLNGNVAEKVPTPHPRLESGYGPNGGTFSAESSSIPLKRLQEAVVIGLQLVPALSSSVDSQNSTTTPWEDRFSPWRCSLHLENLSPTQEIMLPKASSKLLSVPLSFITRQRLTGVCGCATLDSPCDISMLYCAMKDIVFCIVLSSEPRIERNGEELWDTSMDFYLS